MRKTKIRLWIRRNLMGQTTVLCMISLMIGVFLGNAMSRNRIPAAAEDAQIIPAAEICYEAPEEEKESPDYDAECVARVLYGLRDYQLSDTAKTAVIEVILNRVEDKACEFRTVNTIAAVCNQKDQWQGYVFDGDYLRDDYNLSMEVIYGGSHGRIVPEGCYFLLVSRGQVTARTLWNGGNEWTVK